MQMLVVQFRMKNKKKKRERKRARTWNLSSLRKLKLLL